jgi:hypothetical protein
MLPFDAVAGSLLLVSGRHCTSVMSVSSCRFQ